MTTPLLHDLRHGGVVKDFRDVFMADTTAMTFPRMLTVRLPGRRDNSSQAAPYLHLAICACVGREHKFKVSVVPMNIHRRLLGAPWVKGRLLLSTLAYFRYHLCDCVDRLGGYFLTNLATSPNSCIAIRYRLYRGSAVELEGKHQQAGVRPKATRCP